MSKVSEILQSTLLDLIESTDDTILILASHDPMEEPRIVYVNPSFCRISGYTEDEIIGETKRILQGPDTCKKTLARIESAIKGGKGCREELLNYAKDGTPYWFDIHIIPLHTDNSDTKYFGAIQRDVTKKRSAFDELERLAHQDILTGIGNRAALQRHMEHLANSDDDTHKKHCMLLYDMDGFKEINDTLGHIAGDNVLRRFAEYLTSTLGSEDFLARLGGDEFVVILRDYLPQEALDFAEKAVSNLASMKVEGVEKTSVSVGMTSFHPGDEMEAVIAGADTALYRAKHSGKGTVRVYRPANGKDQMWLRGEPGDQRQKQQADI